MTTLIFLLHQAKEQKVVGEKQANFHLHQLPLKLEISYSLLKALEEGVLKELKKSYSEQE